MNPRSLYRSADDRWIAGVAAGVADYFDVDPILARVIWLILIPVTAGFALLAYIIMVVVVPLEPGEMPPQSPWQPGGTPTGFAGPYAPPTQPTANPDAAASGAFPAGAAAPSESTAGATPAGAAPTPNVAPGWDWSSQSRQDRWQRRADRWQRRADRWQERGESRGSGSVVFGVLLIGVGGMLAWHAVNPSLDLGLVWPIAMIVFGAFLVLSAVGFRRGE